MRMRLAAGTLLALLASACASSPAAHFYTLDAVPAPSRAARPATPVQVAAVHLPGSLDRRQLVAESQPNRLELNEDDRWGAPLDEMARRVLTEDLLQRLPPAAVILPDQPAPAAANAVVVDVLRYERDVSGDVILRGSWTLLPAQSNVPLRTRHFDFRAAAPAGSSGQAQAMSVLLGQLADQIAGALPPAPR